MSIYLSMKYVLPVTVHLKLLPVIKNFLQMSHLLQLTIALLLLMLGLGYKKGFIDSFYIYIYMYSNR